MVSIASSCFTVKLSSPRICLLWEICTPDLLRLWAGNRERKAPKRKTPKRLHFRIKQAYNSTGRDAWGRGSLKKKKKLLTLMWSSLVYSKLVATLKTFLTKKKVASFKMRGNILLAWRNLLQNVLWMKNKTDDNNRTNKIGFIIFLAFYRNYFYLC